MNKKSAAKKIIVIDDDSVIVQGMLISFELAGFSTECIITGHDIKTIIRRSKPHCIFLDIKLANGTDGREIARELKSDPQLARIPIVLISANPNLEHEAARCRADDYLEKPFSVSDIVEKARYYTGKKRMKALVPDLQAK